MKLDKQTMQLYAITDRSCLGSNNLIEYIEQAILGGVTILQLREKDIDYDTYVKLATEVKQITDQYNIPLIINDRVDVALASNASGVHIGINDMKIHKARTMLGKDKIIGVSARTVEQALDAQKNGADYLGVGAVFNTNTKKDAKSISLDVLRDICCAVNIPVVAIGGITVHNILDLKNCNMNGVAVISAIFAQENPYKASQELYSLSKLVTE